MSESQSGGGLSRFLPEKLRPPVAARSPQEFLNLLKGSKVATVDIDAQQKKSFEQLPDGERDVYNYSVRFQASANSRI